MVAFAAFAALATLASMAPVSAFSPMTSLARRDATQVTISCSSGQGISGCDCPADLNGDTGVLINVFPGYQCAYPGGACTWSDNTGKLQNDMQTNCPTVAPCPSTGCECPIDNNADPGVLINQFKGYQCAYPSGACLWDNLGALSNTHQTNCPTVAKCAM